MKRFANSSKISLAATPPPLTTPAPKPPKWFSSTERYKKNKPKEPWLFRKNAEPQPIAKSINLVKEIFEGKYQADEKIGIGLNLLGTGGAFFANITSGSPFADALKSVSVFLGGFALLALKPWLRKIAATVIPQSINAGKALRNKDFTYEVITATKTTRKTAKFDEFAALFTKENMGLINDTVELEHAPPPGGWGIRAPQPKILNGATTPGRLYQGSEDNKAYLISEEDYNLIISAGNAIRRENAIDTLFSIGIVTAPMIIGYRQQEKGFGADVPPGTRNEPLYNDPPAGAPSDAPMAPPRPSAREPIRQR